MSAPDIDRFYMARALELAAKGLYTTRPNPRVGCVIVQFDTAGEGGSDSSFGDSASSRAGSGSADAAPVPSGRIVAEAWTAPAGGLHAEARALEIAGPAARGATVYCTLEPCAHYGRTPPCADALVRAQPARVVVAAGDPFDQVDGAGLAKLRAAGIRVDTGVLEAEARALNPGFHRRHEGGRPWVRLKIAASLDGRTAMASGESRWITGAAARRDVQHLRARSCAIVTGVGTVLADDPRMTLRAGELDDLPAFDLAFLARRPPLRVVLDSALRTPSAAQILASGSGTMAGVATGATDEAAATLIVTTADSGAGSDPATRARRAALAERARIVEVAAESTPSSSARGATAQRPGLAAVLDLLATEHCNEVLLECGPVLAGAALQAGLVDELWLYQAPVLMGASARPLAQFELGSMAERLRFTVRDTARIGDDMRWILAPAGATGSPAEGT